MTEHLPAVLRLRPPQMGYCDNPLVGLQPELLKPVGVGVTLASLAPEPRGLLTLNLNGEWVLRGYWGELTRHGDIIWWYDEPQGREGVRVLLAVAIIVASVVPGGQAFLPYLIAANAAYNLLVPPKQPKRYDQQAGSVYSVALGGNQARLDQPIWKNCGRMKTTPPFAAQPYLEFIPKNPADPYGETDQYSFTVLAVGIGNHDFEKGFIGKTSIAHFRDVLVAQYLPPGTQPSRALCNVTTSDDVSGIELADGRYSAAYTVCRPGDRVKYIGVDVAASQGLGVAGVDSHSITCVWQVEFREINDLGGSPLGEWQVIATESRTANTNTPLRWSSKYELPRPMRCEVRLVRLDTKNKDSDARDGIQWIGLRGYRDGVAPLNPDTAYFEVVMRASEQLSSYSQSDFSLITRAKCRTWDPNTGWGPQVFTRNPAWWFAELATSTVWGLGLPDDRVDLAGIHAWAQTLEARQDHFDYCFAQGSDAWDALQLIASAGRARRFMRAGRVLTIARDELVDLPSAGFTPANTAPKSMKLEQRTPKREAPNGIVVEYLSNVTWDTAVVECPCPGFTVTDPADSRYDPALPSMSAPEYQRYEGITGAKHAEREGLYHAADMALRTAVVSCTTEMQGVIVSCMQYISWLPQIAGYGQAGEVAFWDADTLVMGLTEPPDFSGEALYLTLQRDDMSLTTPVLVTPGPTQWDVTLPAEPDFELVLDGGTRERPKYILGPLETGDELAKIASITDGGKTEGGAQLYDITAVIDDDRVHLADVHLLPGPDEIQDPIDDGSDVADDDGGGGGLATFVRLREHTFVGYSMGGQPPAHIDVNINTDGTLTANDGDVADDGTPAYDGTGHHLFAGEWLNTSPVEPGVSDAFEVMLADPYGFVAALLAANPANLTFTGTLDTWLPLTSTRSWALDSEPGVAGTATVYMRIRRVASSLVLEDRQISLILNPGSGDSGGAGGPGKIICTAMNDRYGLPYRENRVWLKYSRRHLAPAHQVGYHKVFLPLVTYGYDAGRGWSHDAVRAALEWIAVTRTADIEAEMAGLRPRPFIRALRRAAEWLLYRIGVAEQRRKQRE